MLYDLIVCGAGPSGTIAATIAAQAGLKVALLEKHILPRHKTCGGGTPMVMQTFLRDLAPEAFVESTVLSMRQTWNFGDPYLANINASEVDRPLSIWMVQRPIFDNVLAQRAIQAGAELRDGLAVRSVVLEGDQVRVSAQAIKAHGGLSKGDAFVATARTVIGADGANGITATAASLRQKRSIALAMEIEFPHEWGTGHPDLRSDVAHLEYGAVKRGYAWAFPKADHVNIGAILFPAKRHSLPVHANVSRALKQAITRYLEALQLRYEVDALKFHAHPLPIWGGKEPLHTHDGRILLVGDAAGLINPFFGDGILHAVKSGTIAAECILENAVASYSDRIQAEFAANFDAALNLARFFYQYPGVCYKYGVKNPKAARLATELICGELSFNSIFGRAVNRIRRSMTDGFLGQSLSNT